MTMGWTCPCCSRCYSPSVVQCTHCGPNQVGVTTGTITLPTCEHEWDFARTVPCCKKCGAPYASLAAKLCDMPPSEGRTEALQRLLMSRDAAVRVFLGK